ncbi:VOC family protein [Paucisalibacillus globulus]|uniref:VOC family protein n=1 Tax=Paucisalibacillus globulus TaxID=351095 RepID=UPI00040503F4|nr:glyoxalase/bleomycin resistance/dioxygenase family protein [Paucisalibacillus globulus]
MNFIKRVGTTYLPVKNPELSSKWFQTILGASINYLDEQKAILDFANQSFFLVKASPGEQSGFLDSSGNEHFSLTFEVDGLGQLREFHTYLKRNSVKIGEIEDRGHPGNNFVFYDLDGNKFDVWSELSKSFR